VKLDPTAEEEEDPATDVGAINYLQGGHVEKRKDSSVEFMRKDSSVEFVEKVFLDLDDDGASTLVGHDHETAMFGEKEIDMEVTDSEGEGEVESPAEECGVKRKRTIRVIIRSRAFL
jgi:hypothetical protein